MKNLLYISSVIVGLVIIAAAIMCIGDLAPNIYKCDSGTKFISGIFFLFGVAILYAGSRSTYDWLRSKIID